MTEETKINKSTIYKKLSLLLMTDDLRLWNYPESTGQGYLDIKNNI